MQRGIDIVGVIRHDDELVVRIVLAQLLHAVEDIGRRLDDIRITVLIDQDIDRVLAIQTTIALDAGILLADGSYSCQRYRLVISILDLDLLDIGCLGILGDDAHIGFRLLRIDRAGRQQLVFRLDRIRDARERQLVGRHLVAVDLDCNFFVAPAMQLDLRDTPGLLQHFLEYILSLRIGVSQTVLRHDRELDDWLGVHIALDDDRCLGLIRQLAHDGFDLFRRIDSCGIRIRIELELEPHACLLIAGRRCYLLYIRHRGDSVLDGLYDLLLDRLGTGPRIFHADRHIRRIQRRQQLDADAVVAVAAQYHEESHDHRYADRALDR